MQALSQHSQKSRLRYAVNTCLEHLDGETDGLFLFQSVSLVLSFSKVGDGWGVGRRVGRRMRGEKEGGKESGGGKEGEDPATIFFS